MKLGIGTYCYMWSIGFEFGDKEARPPRPLGAFDLLDRAHELGLHLVQYGPNLPLDALSKAELERFVAQAQVWDIELELGTRGMETEHLARQIALARRLGAKVLRTIPEIGGQPPPLADIPGCLLAIQPLAEAAGVKVGIENGRIAALDLKWVLDTVGSPTFGIILDMANSFAVPEGWRYVTEILAPYTICLHHKEFIVKRAWHMMGFIIEGQPSGQGLVDTPWLLATLDKAGAHYNVILELWPPEQASIEETIALEDRWVVESIPYLRQFIKE